MASANLVSPMMPPSVALIIYGATAGASISFLFLAGNAPAVYMTLVTAVVWLFMFLAAAAQAAAYYMAISGLPGMISKTLSGLTENPTLLMIVLMLFILFVGLALDVIPTTLIFTPIFVPLLNEAGFNLIYFGIVFTLANVLGLLTPPVGPSLNVAAAVGRVKVGALMGPVLPYLVAQTILVVAMALLPQPVLVPLGWLGGS
jgi:TRAP-type transport system large permease protein